MAILILVTIKIPVAVAESSGAIIDEQEFRNYLVEIFESDIYSDYGFNTDDVDQMSFGDPIAIYDLNPSFAFGEDEDMLQNRVEEWIAIVYENDKAINGLKLRENNSGELEISGFGYPLTLARAVEQLDQNELLFYEFPTGYYYAFNQQNDTVRLLEEEVISIYSDEQTENLSEEEFQKKLEERYDNVEKGDETISGFGGTEQVQEKQSILLYSSLGFGVVLFSSLLFFLWKRKHA